MKVLVLGFSNPQKIYSNTRHNIGLLFVEYFLKKQLNTFNWVKKAKLHTEVVNCQNVLFAHCLLGYNLIGRSVNALINYYGDFDNVIFIHDDLKLKFGELRLNYTQEGMDIFKLDDIMPIYLRKSHYGNNALKSIYSTLPNLDFMHLRIGTGYDEATSHSEHVLGQIGCVEREELLKIFDSISMHLSQYIFE